MKPFFLLIVRSNQSEMVKSVCQSADRVHVFVDKSFFLSQEKQVHRSVLSTDMARAVLVVS